MRGSDFSPWQPWWEIRVSRSGVYPTLRGGSATARLGYFRLACVADQISRSAARIVFATLRGGSDFRDCNENILLFFSSTQAREIRAAARRWRKRRARSLRGERGRTKETVKSLGRKKKNFPPGYVVITVDLSADWDQAEPWIHANSMHVFLRGPSWVQRI